jgi:hypothetical protein
MEANKKSIAARKTQGKAGIPSQRSPREELGNNIASIIPV